MGLEAERARNFVSLLKIPTKISPLGPQVVNPILEGGPGQRSSWILGSGSLVNPLGGRAYAECLGPKHFRQALKTLETLK